VEKKKRLRKEGMILKHMNKILLALFIAVSAFLILMPFAWMLSISLRPNDEIMRFPPTIFGGIFTLEKYPEFLRKWDFLRLFGNTVFMSITSAVGTAVTSALAGFAFAKYDFKGKNVIFYGLMATIMIPIFVILIPMFIIINNLHWYDTFYALIVPFLASPLGIFLMRQFIYAIPNDLIYAARIDGCSEYRIFLKVIIPSAVPALASLVILIFMLQWDSYLWPVIMTNSQEMKVLTTQMAMISRTENASTNWNLVMVGAVLSTAPIVILYLFMQRYFISSITMTGIKD
jgi:ABC-type glycerol-3-phosphate transport system permease component